MKKDTVRKNTKIITLIPISINILSKEIVKVHIVLIIQANQLIEVTISKKLNFQASNKQKTTNTKIYILKQILSMQYNPKRLNVE